MARVLTLPLSLPPPLLRLLLQAAWCSVLWQTASAARIPSSRVCSLTPVGMDAWRFFLSFGFVECIAPHACISQLHPHPDHTPPIAHLTPNVTSSSLFLFAHTRTPTVSAGFGVMSSFLPAYEGLIVTRIMAGFGVGGSVPGVFTLAAGG